MRPVKMAWLAFSSTHSVSQRSFLLVSIKLEYKSLSVGQGRAEVFWVKEDCVSQVQLLSAVITCNSNSSGKTLILSHFPLLPLFMPPTLFLLLSLS